MVSPQNPLKRGATDLLDDEQRFRLAQKALEGETGIIASDYEFRLPKPSYTWHTLKALRQDNPDRTFVLIIHLRGVSEQLFLNWYFERYGRQEKRKEKADQ